MKVLGFCEGARAESGGIGLIGVPHIHQAIAEQGNVDALVIGGEPIPSAGPMLRDDLREVMHSMARGGCGVVPFAAKGRWYFSAALFRAAMANAASADFITLHSMYSFPVFAGYVAAKRHGKPYGLWPHGVFAPVQRAVGSLHKAIYDGLIGRRILTEASVLFFSAEGERDEARSLGLSVPSVIIPHGIDARPFERLPPRGVFRDKYMSGHQGPLVLYLGRLNIKKGLDLLVDSLACVVRRIPDARLAIVGGGHPASFAAQVQHWVAQAGIQESTVLTGPLDETEKLAAFSDCDVFVLPSAAENFGFAMFEAMASGRAVVCSDTLDYAGEVSRWGAGVIAKRTVDDFAGAILRLLSDPELRKTMGQNGKRLAKNYSWDLCGRRVESAIQSIVRGEPFPQDLKPEGTPRKI